MTTLNGSGGNAPGIFWGEIAPCDHIVHIYQREEVFMDALEAFIVDGLKAQDSVIIIATPSHREGLEERLTRHGLDVALLRSQDRYIDLDSDVALSQFMLNGWPDADRFNRFIVDLLVRAIRKGHRVRAFGEMVAGLWSKGHKAATIRLEQLWHRICEADGLALFCAYPRVGFQDAEDSLREICAAHSKAYVL